MQAQSESFQTERSPALDAVKGLLEELTVVLAEKGISVQPFSSLAVANFLALPLKRQEGIEQALQGILHLTRSAIGSSPIQEPQHPQQHPEKELVLKALKSFGVELRDDIWAHIGPQEVIEIYDENDIQIFRTLNFFRLSSYSLLDLLTNEWFHLWERPTSILENMMDLSRRLHSSINGIEPAGISRHILKEIFEDKSHSVSSRKSILIDFNVVCPLYRKGQPQRSGYVITCNAKILDQGRDVDNVLFV